LIDSRKKRGGGQTPRRKSLMADSLTAPKKNESRGKKRPKKKGDNGRKKVTEVMLFPRKKGAKGEQREERRIPLFRRRKQTKHQQAQKKPIEEDKGRTASQKKVRSSSPR